MDGKWTCEGCGTEFEGNVAYPARSVVRAPNVIPQVLKFCSLCAPGVVVQGDTVEHVPLEALGITPEKPADEATEQGSQETTA